MNVVMYYLSIYSVESFQPRLVLRVKTKRSTENMDSVTFEKQVHKKTCNVFILNHSLFLYLLFVIQLLMFSISGYIQE